MRKTIALLAAGLLALVVLTKTTGVSSYVGTLWSQTKMAAKQQVPTKFEIDRIRHDIASLDQDLDNMIRPIAEHKVAVDRLRKQVAEDDVKLSEQRTVLLDAIAAVKAAKKNDKLVYAGKAYSVDSVQMRIKLDSEAFKKFEANLKAARTLLEAKEKTLAAAQEQLQTFVSKKREFELQLAQLEAENEVNQVAAVGTEIKIDNTRLATIAQSLGELKDRIDVQKTALETKQGMLDHNSIQLNQPQQNPAVDLESIEAHLQNGVAPAKTVSTK